MNAVVSTLLAQNSNKQGGGLLSLLIFIVPLGLLFYLMVVPQRKQRQKQQQFLSSLDVGDEVVTTGGIYGRITYLEDGVAHLEVDTDVVIKVSISSLSRAASEPEAPAGRGAESRKQGAVDLTEEPPAAEEPEPKPAKKKGT